MKVRARRFSAALISVLLGAALESTAAAWQSAVPSPAGAPVRQFVAVSLNRFPRSVVMRDFCEDYRDLDCWRSLRRTGKVWAADVNGDGDEELIIQPGTIASGSAGMSFYLYQRRGKTWESIASDWEERDTGWSGDDGDSNSPGWGTDRPRLEILPISRNGYRDLRIAVDVCLKWDGGKYIPYEPADYRLLSPAWFNDKDPREAEIFWKIHYAGDEPIHFEPQWFPITSCFLLDESDAPHATRCNWTRAEMSKWCRCSDFPFPNGARGALNDSEANLRWVSIPRAGVWGIIHRRGFLLVPRTSYLGVCNLVLDGDWLAGSEACQDFDLQTQADFRYNRLTHDLRVEF